MAPATAKKLKKTRRLTAEDDKVMGLWIEPSLLPTRLAQQGLKGQRVQSIFEPPRQASDAERQERSRDDLLFALERRQRPQ
jgi:hypothetical protein